MKLNMSNIMQDAAAKFVPSCCGAVICSFTDKATEEEISTQVSKMHGRVVIVVGGNSYPKSVTKLYDGVGLTQVNMCSCGSKCPLSLVPQRNIDETIVFGSRRLSKIADSVFILQTLNGIKEDEIKDVVANMDTGDVIMAISVPDYHDKETDAFLACGWKLNKEHAHHTYGNKRVLNMLSFKK